MNWAKLAPDIDVHSGSPKKSVCRIVNCLVTVKDANDKWRQVNVDRVELTIDHAILRRLVDRAANNKSRKSSDGPLTVNILSPIPEQKKG